MRRLSLAFFLWCCPLWGVISVGQAVVNTNNAATTIAKAFPFDNVPHHLLVVAAYSRRVTSGPPTLTVADTAGNTYSQAQTFVDSGPFVRGYVFYVCDSAAGANTVTVTGSGGTTGLELGVLIAEVSGVVTTSCLDTGIAGAAAFSAAVLSQSATTTINKDFVFGMFTGASLTAGDVGPGYTNISTVFGAFVEAQFEWQTQATAGATTVTAALSGNQSWIALGAAFFSATDASPLTGNAVGIRNITNSALTNQPFSVMRVFTRGEIAAYARPSITGTPATFWQCDRKTTWDDGSLQSAIISFRATVAANSIVAVSFANNANPSSAGNASATASAALTKAQILAYDTGGGSGSWNAITAITNGSTHTIDSKTILTAWDGTDTGVSGGGVRYWLKGPVATQVIVEDKTSARAYDTGFATGNPIHPIFELTFYPSDGGSIANWAGVRTEFDMENAWTGNEAGTGMQMIDDSYSVVLQTGASPTTVYSQSTFTHYARTRWRQKCWSGTAADRTSNAGTRAGTPLYVIDLNFPYLTASKVIWNWDTTLVPPAYVYDPSGSATYNSDGGFSEVALALSYPDQGTNPNDLGEFQPHTGGGGARGDDKKLLSRWDVYFLYSMASPYTFHSWRMWDVVLGNGEVGAHVPMHFRENLTGRKYCQYSQKCIDQTLDSVDAFGKWWSIDSRVGARLYPGNELGGFGATIDNAAIGVSPTYHVANCHVGCGGANWGGGPGNGTSDWGYEIAHQYEYSLIAYLMTGDYFQLEELQLWGSIPIAMFSEGSGPSSARGPNHIGFISGETDYRNQAWAMRAMSDAWMLSPDGTAEKAYILQKILNNIAVKEGRFNISLANGGFFYTGGTNDNDPWYFGHHTIDYFGANPANLALNALGYDGAYEGGCPQDVHVAATNYCCGAGATCTQETFETYFIRIMYAFMYDRGITQVLPVFRASSRFFLHQVLDSLANPWLTAAEFYPSFDASFGADVVLFQTWANYFNAFSSEMKAVPNNGSNGWTYMAGASPALISSNSQNTLELDYPRLMRAGTASMKDLGVTAIDSTNGSTLTGSAAWDWFQANGNDSARDFLMPNYALIPRGSEAPPPAVGIFPLPSGFQRQ